MQPLFVEHREDVLAVDDLRMMIHAVYARHLSVQIPRELEHRDRRAVLAFECQTIHVAGILENHVEQAIVDDAIVPVVGQLLRESREPRMLRAGI